MIDTKNEFANFHSNRLQRAEDKMCRQNSYLQIAERHKIIQAEEELRKKPEAIPSNEENLPEGDHVQSCVLTTFMKEILLEKPNLNS